MSTESLESRSRTLKRTALLAGGSIALTAALSACGSEASAQNADERFGLKDTSITTITLESNARLRHEPYVEDQSYPDNLPIVDPEDLQDSVEVSVEGAHLDRDNNGIWYGIDAKDLAVALPDLSDTLKDDSDGIIWVNSQKAVVGERH